MRLFRRAWHRYGSLGLEASRFAVAGVVCFALEYAALFLLAGPLGVQYLVANGVAFTASVILNYWMSVAWVFDGAKDSGHIVRAAFVAVSIVGLGINQVLLWALVSGLGMRLVVAKVLVSGVVLVWNYVGKRRVMVGDG
ncbi:GtrA family protein [Demequina salsinemoris]|uniref:GtrA family protein n=1 Tax=Demequina salsinemoris TaxID=577470 RepID=UPI000780D8F8|nr:GtrA family protein [Demequina salsinemoris]